MCSSHWWYWMCKLFPGFPLQQLNSAKEPKLLLYVRKGFSFGSQHNLSQHVCWHPVELKYRENVGGSQGFTQKILRGTQAEDQVPVPGNQGGGSADCSTALSLRIASFSVLKCVHSSPSAWRRGAAAAEVMNASTTWWRRNNERKVNSHWTYSLIHVSILGTCSCNGR